MLIVNISCVSIRNKIRKKRCFRKEVIMMIMIILLLEEEGGGEEEREEDNIPISNQAALMSQAKALVRPWVKVTKSKAGQSKVTLNRVVLGQVVRQLNT